MGIYRDKNFTNRIIWCDDKEVMVDISTRKHPEAKMLIDSQDWEFIRKTCGRVFAMGKKDGKLYAATNHNGKVKRVHVLLFETRAVRDHINGNSLDNRRGNIRYTDPLGNAQNHKRRVDNTSGVCGVRWHKDNKNWVARINVNKKYIHLGSFNCKSDAVKARVEAEERYFGEYQYKGENR